MSAKITEPMGIIPGSWRDVMNRHHTQKGARRNGSENLDTIGRTYPDGSTVIGSGSFYSIRVKPSGASAPLPRDVQQRIDKLLNRKSPAQLATDRRAKRLFARIDALRPQLDRLAEKAKADKQADIARRLQKLGLRTAPDAQEQEIRARIDAQPRDYRETLGALFAAWESYNELYFGGRLQLPEIQIKQLSGAQADCSTAQLPTVIRFSPTTLVAKSVEQQADILLHEMIHQCVGERDGALAAWGGDEWRGHHAEFRRIANNIAKQRGWPDCSEHCLHGATAAQYWPPRTHH